MNKSFFHRKRRDIFKTAGLLISALLMFCWKSLKERFGLPSPFLDTMTPETQAFMLFITGIGFSITISNVFTKDELSDKMDEELSSIMEEFRKLSDLFSKNTNLIRHGSLKDVYNQFKEKLMHASTVYNTCINTISYAEYWEDYTISEREKEISSAVKDFFTSGGERWVDVLSSNMTSRINSVREQIGNHTGYVPYVLKKDFPIINFIVIEYNRSHIIRKQVFFGFGLHDNDKDGLIFSSTNIDVVRYFENYFRSLANNENSTYIRAK